MQKRLKEMRRVQFYRGGGRVEVNERILTEPGGFDNIRRARTRYLICTLLRSLTVFY